MIQIHFSRYHYSEVYLETVTDIILKKHFNKNKHKVDESLFSNNLKQHPYDYARVKTAITKRLEQVHQG